MWAGSEFSDTSCVWKLQIRSSKADCNKYEKNNINVHDNVHGGSKLQGMHKKPKQQKKACKNLYKARSKIKLRDELRAWEKFKGRN